MRKTNRRIVLVLLSIVLCLVIALTIAACSNKPAATEAIYREISNPVTVTMAKTTTVCSPPIITETAVEPTEDVWPYSISQEEIDLIALVTMAEAEGETELGKRLVIDTILNRMDDSHFPDTVHDVIYYPNAFSVMWNGRIDRCYVMDEIVELVKEELLERTNYECVFFMSGGYSKYGEPMFQECCHYFSSYE